MDLKSRLRRIEGLGGFQASSMSPLRSGLSSQASHTSTPLRTATPRDFKPPNISSIKSKSPALTNRSEDTYRPPSHWSRPSESETWTKLLAEKEQSCSNLSQALEEMRAEVCEKNRQISELRSCRSRRGSTGARPRSVARKAYRPRNHSGRRLIR